MRNIAVFGGSFNPVHNGHIALAQKMRDKFSLEEIILIPTFQTPLKDNTPMVSPEHRLNMLRIAFKDIDYVSISDIEIERQGNSYTVDTLSEIVKKYPDDKLHIIVGADAFMQLPLWRFPEIIFRLAKVLTIARDSVDYEMILNRAYEYENVYNAECGVIKDPVSDLSSTKVRNAIKAGKDTKQYLPKAVSEYIKEQKFYG